MIDINIAIESSRNYFTKTPKNNLIEALQEYDSPIYLLASLLYACGFPYISSQYVNDSIELFSGYEPNKLKNNLTFYKNNKTLSGDLSETVQKAFLVINAIENDLSEAILLPIEMRKRRIESLCNKIQIDQNFFQLVLRNW